MVLKSIVHVCKHFTLKSNWHLQIGYIYHIKVLILFSLGFCSLVIKAHMYIYLSTNFSWQRAFTQNVKMLFTFRHLHTHFTTFSFNNVMSMFAIKACYIVFIHFFYGELSWNLPLYFRTMKIQIHFVQSNVRTLQFSYLTRSWLMPCSRHWGIKSRQLFMQLSTYWILITHHSTTIDWLYMLQTLVLKDRSVPDDISSRPVTLKAWQIFMKYKTEWFR